MTEDKRRDVIRIATMQVGELRMPAARMDVGHVRFLDATEAQSWGEALTVCLRSIEAMGMLAPLEVAAQLVLAFSEKHEATVDDCLNEIDGFIDLLTDVADAAEAEAEAEADVS